MLIDETAIAAAGVVIGLLLLVVYVVNWLNREAKG